MSIKILGIYFGPDFGFRSPAQREIMRFDPCANHKDGLTEESLRSLQRIQLFDELEP